MRTSYLYLGLLALLVLPAAALAQEFTPLTNLPGVADAAGTDSLPTFFNNLYKLCIGAAAVIAVIQIMRAGMYFMFNKGSVAHNEKAKGLISSSILGLLLVLSPTIIFGIINPDILSLKLDLNDIKIENSLTPQQQEAQNQALNGAAAPKECTTKYSGITAQNGGQCSTANGIVEIPTSCCSKVSGVVCCGRPVVLSDNPTPGQRSYVLNYVTEDLDYSTNDGKCVVRDTKTYPSLAACQAEVRTIYTERDCGTKKCRVATNHNCTSDGSPKSFPSAAEYDRIDSLPSC